MQKILSVSQIREADLYTINNEPVSSVGLMERAGWACAFTICGVVAFHDRIGVVSGRGNNGGDGLVITRRLLEMGYDVEVFLVGGGEEGSSDFVVNLERLKQAGVPYAMLEEGFDPLCLNGFDWIVDAILGSGLARPVKGLPAAVIDAVNFSDAGVISIDMPSGLFADGYTDPSEGSIVRADITLTLEVLKLAMVMPCSSPYTGTWQVVPIGLDAGFLRSLNAPFRVFDFEDAVALFRPRSRVSHKGDHGHGLLMAGCSGTGGAALLAAGGALRSGAGLLTAAVPFALEIPFLTLHPEAMVAIEPGDLSELTCAGSKRFTAVAAGPGWGTGADRVRLLRDLLASDIAPLVLDADALNILSINPEWLGKLPPGTILTPHPKEFERLAGKADDDFHRLQLAIEFARNYSCILVLKTAYPVVVSPDGTCAFSIHGTAGLAKGGSGDILTGIILGCLCRGYAPESAALLGVYLHARAATLVAESSGLDAMIASDVTAMLSYAFKELENGMQPTDPAP